MNRVTPNLPMGDSYRDAIPKARPSGCPCAECAGGDAESRPEDSAEAPGRLQAAYFKKKGKYPTTATKRDQRMRMF